MTLHNFRLVCANGQLFRDGRPCETCVGSHPWHGVRHKCWRGSRALTVPAAATIALHRRLGTWTGAVDLYLALNQFARGRLVAGGLPAEKVAVKPNFTGDPGRRAAPAAGSATVMFVGRLSREKGVDVLLEAWARLGEGSVRLVVVGDGPLRADLERRAGDGVTFTGRLDPVDVRRRMLGARAVVVPSAWYEGQPMVVLEALAAGLPVVASDIGGLPELIAAGDAGDAAAGWLARPGDVDGWVGALRRLLDPGAV